MRWIVAASALLLALLSCKGVTEHSTTGEYQVTVLDADDLSPLGTVDLADEGRLLVSMGGSDFLVLASSGKLYHCDSEMLCIDSTTTIPASGGGVLSKAVKMSGSLYVLTGGATVTEISLGDFTVEDQLQVGSAPSDICATPTGEPVVWILDGSDGKIRELYAPDNSVRSTSSLAYGSPSAVTANQEDPGSLVICYDDPDGSLTSLDLATMYENRFDRVSPYHCSAAACYPPDSLVWAILPDPGCDGYLYIYRGWDISVIPRSIQLDGSPTDLALDPAGSFGYVLTSPGTSGGGPAVCRVDSDSITFGITHQVERGGRTAWDMSVHAGGDKLLVLTSQ